MSRIPPRAHTVVCSLGRHLNPVGDLTATGAGLPVQDSPSASREGHQSLTLANPGSMPHSRSYSLLWRQRQVLAAVATVLLAVSRAEGERPRAAGEGRHNPQDAQCRTGGISVEPPKNVVLFVGDGMGPSHVALARTVASAYTGQRALAFEHSLVGSSRTRSLNHHVTDSAASGTALATGHRTHNGFLGVLPWEELPAGGGGGGGGGEGRRLTTVLEAARAKGMTGVGPGRYCPLRHRVAHISRSEGSKCVG